MDPMSGYDILCLNYRQETVHCSTKDACAHLWNNFPCIITLVVPLYKINKFSPSQSSIFKLYRIQYYTKPVYLGFLSNIHLSVDVNQIYLLFPVLLSTLIFYALLLPFSYLTPPPFFSILFSKVPHPKLQIMKLKRGGGTNSPPPEKQVLYPPLLWNFYISWRIPVKSLVSVQFIRLRQETFSNTHHHIRVTYSL